VSVLWVVPLVVLAAGAVLIAAKLRTTAEATIALQQECARIEELRTALDDVRSEADMTRAGIDRIRQR
jgi:cytochrome c-type biogenesis protein CcmH/NrfF